MSACFCTWKCLQVSVCVWTLWSPCSLPLARWKTLTWDSLLMSFFHKSRSLQQTSKSATAENRNCCHGTNDWDEKESFNATQQSFAAFIQGMCLHYIIYDQGRILEPISRLIYILIQLNVDSLNPFANNVNRSRSIIKNIYIFVVQVWNYMNASKLWQNYNFWVNYTFNVQNIVILFENFNTTIPNIYTHTYRVWGVRVVVSETHLSAFHLLSTLRHSRYMIWQIFT